MPKKKRAVRCLLVVPFLVAILFLREAAPKNLSEEDQLIQVGIGAFQDGFYDLAERQFSLFLRDFPTHGRMNEVSYLLGRTFLYQRKWKEAKAAFSRILLDNRNFEAIDYTLFWMAQTEMKLGNLEGSRKWLLFLLKNYTKFEWTDCAYFLLGCLDVEANRWNLSEASFKKVLHLSKREELIQSSAFWLGVVFLKQNDFETAARYLKPFKEDSKSLSSAYWKEAVFWLGEAEFRLGRYQEAKGDYQALYSRLKQDALIPQAYWRMGLCDYRSGHLKEALDLFRTFQSRFGESPLLPYTHYLLGEIFLIQGDYASSVRSFNQVLQSPQVDWLSGTALLLLHWNYVLSNEREEAHRIFQRAFKQNAAEEEKFLLQWLVAEILFAEGKIVDALPYYFGLLNSRFRGKALLQIARGYFFENQYREALTNLDILFLEFPSLKSLEEGLFIDGEALLFLGDTTRALGVYGRILTLSERSPWALMALTRIGLHALALGEMEKAVETFQRILRDFPDHPLFYHGAFHLGNLYGERKDFPQASHAYSLVLKGPISELLGPTYFRIGEILIQQGKEEKALSSFKEALRSVAAGSIWFGITQLEIGNLERRERRDKEAKKSYRAALDQTKDEQIKKAASELLERLEGR